MIPEHVSIAAHYGVSELQKPHDGLDASRFIDPAQAARLFGVLSCSISARVLLLSTERDLELLSGSQGDLAWTSLCLMSSQRRFSLRFAAWRPVWIRTNAPL